ncbi:Sir2 family NAD+-dependent deacetylase [Agromyces humi]|uniref:Sir2 family NAD+-dependent deacetylase n=1 Tax=Agromyces humi TaxID=1766800 RepID=UPI0013588D6E|nr:Sir2 family NAD+-dependent deacetylase [Agromyces humi]
MRAVVLTGAGISAESGIRTFRDAGGTWENHRIEDVATPDGYARNPELVHRFYNERRRQLADVEPNAAHLALVRLEQHLGDDLLVVTQNVDNLHERAGTRNLIHMHGELNSALCTVCRERTPWTADLGLDDECSVCGMPTLRPDVVWFGEFPRMMDRIAAAIASCDVFVSIGTSGTVYPAAGFVRDARAAGAATLELNLEPSTGATLFAERRQGAATELVPDWVEAELNYEF